MTARRPSKVTSSNPRRAPRLRISSVKNPLSRAPASPDATARIAVVLPTPGGPVIRSATGKECRRARSWDQGAARVGRGSVARAAPRQLLDDLSHKALAIPEEHHGLVQDRALSRAKRAGRGASESGS